MFKKWIAASVALLPLSAAAVDYTDTAPVVSATPIYQKVNEPRQECWTETSTAPAPQAQQDRGLMGPIVGGVAGAVVGSQVGKGSGQTAATAVGAAGGAIVGDRVANPDSNRSVTGSIIGGVAGAILGSQVGKGSGRNAAAAAGAIAGAVVGDRIDNANQPQVAAAPQQVQRCRQVDAYRDVISGYTVVYRYAGQNVTTTLPYNPGSTVRVGVGIIDGGGAPSASVPPAQPEPYSYRPQNHRDHDRSPGGGYNYTRR